MGIRHATINDQDIIAALLAQLDYHNTANFLAEKINRLIKDPDSVLLIYETQDGPAAFISLQFITQLGLEGDFARISYFSVDASARGRSIGKEMESYCEQLARQRHCDRMEVHCHERRTGAHRFYLRQGFEESPKYFMKRLA